MPENGSTICSELSVETLNINNMVFWGTIRRPGSRDSSVSIVTTRLQGYTTEVPLFDCQQQQKVLLLSKASRRSVGPTKPRIQWFWRTLSPGIKWPRLEAEFLAVVQALTVDMYTVPPLTVCLLAVHEGSFAFCMSICLCYSYPRYSASCCQQFVALYQGWPYIPILCHTVTRFTDFHGRKRVWPISGIWLYLPLVFGPTLLTFDKIIVLWYGFLFLGITKLSTDFVEVAASWGISEGPCAGTEPWSRMNSNIVITTPRWQHSLAEETSAAVSLSPVQVSF
jgi:hypothetical protein